jgi:hypothetical protein
MDVRYVTHLPPDSALQGQAKGPEIYFKKTNEGTHHGVNHIGDKPVRFEKQSQVVHYGCRVSSDGQDVEEMRSELDSSRSLRHEV